MSRPLKTLPADTPVYGALLFMLQENIHHLPLTRQGQIVGVISDADLLRHRTKSPIYLLKRMEQLGEAAHLAQYDLDIAAMVDILFGSGLDVIQIGRVVAGVNDALTRRLLKLAEAELGPPPTPYAWLVFGSEGRQEQAILTDQDNALIYQEPGEEAQAYFKKLANLVVSRLTEAGFPPCPGGYMASRWCYPLGEWQQLFKNWIHAPNEQALLEAAIFFDFRQVAGELVLDSLEEIMLKAGQSRPFLTHLAWGALGLQPPLSFFRHIREAKEGVDLKRGGIGPIISLARLYALEVGSPARSTLTRLQAASQAKVLTQEEAELLSEAYRFILYLRLREQLHAYHTGGTLSNWVRLKALSALERRHLKEAFLVIRQIQQMTATRFHTDRLG
jgi:CBS domain-containing protein